MIACRWWIVEPGDLFLPQTVRRPANDRVLQVWNMDPLVLCQSQERACSWCLHLSDLSSKSFVTILHHMQSVTLKVSLLVFFIIHVVTYCGFSVQFTSVSLLLTFAHLLGYFFTFSIVSTMCQQCMHIIVPHWCTLVANAHELAGAEQHKFLCMHAIIYKARACETPNIWNWRCITLACSASSHGQEWLLML